MSVFMDYVDVAQIVDNVVADNPLTFVKYKGSEPQAFVFLLGEVMKASRNTANLRHVMELLEKKRKEV